MSTRLREVVKTDYGLGKLFYADYFIGEVEYRYQIARETTSIQTQSGTEAIPGMQHLHGSFSTKSTIDLLGKELRLITTNGKELRITIMAGDPVVKVYIFIYDQSSQK